ncbi:unnamed protein product [Symbiodinium pilosum]|uniref:Uncharacterized protein n=1 Tax=Symbiodinium pilosum TaxID=2952 RepID=A0A812L858_SYMPI|nr:unnamed protein product [Symbiodinium pilosum]
MSLSHVLCLAFVARAYAWARGWIILEKSLQDTSPALGKLQLLGACCDQHIGRAVVQTSINSNALYGSTAEIAKTVFKSSDCTPVTKADWDGKAEADCSYVAIFSNTEFADNEYAANCVPAQVCKDDVVGMTKGLIATYGVALQIMQQNLGSLVHLSEGPILKCYEGQNQILRLPPSTFLKLNVSAPLQDSLQKNLNLRTP